MRLPSTFEEPSRGRPEDGPIGEMSGSSLVSGGLWTLLNRVVPQAQLLALSVITARYLGPDDMGRQSYIAFVALALVQAATAGLPGAVSRFIGELIGARRAGQAITLYRFTRRVERIAGFLVAASLVAVAALGAEPAAAWVLAGLSGGLMVLQSVPMSLLAGAQRWRQAATAGLVTGVASLPPTVVVLAGGGGITGLFAVEAVTVLVNLVWTAELARRVGDRLPPPDPAPPELRRRFLSFAGMTTLIVVIHFVVWRRSELFVLQSQSTDAQIAYYSIAFAAISGLAKLPETIEAITVPAVATLMGEGDHERIRRGFWRAIRVLALIMPQLVAGVAITGPALLRLVYGHEYDGAGPVLLVMLVPLLIQPMLTMSEGILYALGRPFFIVAAGAVATVVDLGLALILIPHLDAVGAAIANGVAQLVAGIPCLVLASRLHRPVSFTAGPLLRSLLLAALVAGTSRATLALLGSGAVGTLASVLTGVAAFGLFGSLVRPLTHDDARWLAVALGPTGARGRAGRLVLRLAPAAEAAP
jgi:O-antigen/teichoic acid export membrane protein